MSRTDQPQCPECGRNFPPGQQRCKICGASLEDVEIPEVRYACLSCGGVLQPKDGDGWHVHICDHCAGLWMSLPMLERLEKVWADAQTAIEADPEKNWIDTSETTPDPMNLERDFELRRCPVCDTVMNRKRYKLSSVVMDECWAHGSWFDANEFKKVLAYLQHGGIRRAEKAEKEWEKRREHQAKRRALQPQIDARMPLRIFDNYL